jgi:cobalt/nickel transport system permease protein
LLTNLAAGLPVSHVLKRASVALPFVLLAAIALPFVAEGRPIWSASVLGLSVRVTTEGLWRLANVLAKAWLALMIAITLAATTPFTEIIRALRGLGLPAVLAAVIALMYRYMFVLVDEAQRMMRAREARSAELEARPQRGRNPVGGSLWWRAQVTGSMIGTLFLRTYERSERIYQAMLARGCQGELLALHQGALTRWDVLAALMGTVSLALLALLANLYW